ncbi:hypothetical protein [Sphingobacterium yanglingense]|uniref:LytTr DNA-binding domain-containing protein n=1 Tax=Sphingobacterium yanglingense TaxID=1437280 RepID=A0A4R6WDX0_9SPHI|nr:hypothetical protein [Sphingobacterium yanglingense]TDQ77972.1 hypothetical protein CLV99_1947 [Sphingobacterium yanglingense]
MKNDLLPAVDKLPLPAWLKSIFVGILHFVFSPYYGWRIGVLWPFFLGYAYAMFPFEDMSVGYAMRPAVFATAVEATLIIAAIIYWVMYVCYLLDTRYDWHTKLSQRLVFQVWLGVLIPFGLLLGYLWQVYGLEMMVTEYMHFVYALFLIFLVILNRQGYIVYLLNETAASKKNRDALAQDLSLANERAKEAVSEQRLVEGRSNGLQEQLKIAQLENLELREQVELLQKEKLTLVAELADKAAKLEVKNDMPGRAIYELSNPGKESRFFEQREMSRFQIVDRKNKKPVIYLFLNTEEKILITESSLTALAATYTDMIHVGRDLLVGRQTLTRLIKDEEGGLKLEVNFQDELIGISLNRWKTIRTKVEHVLAERNKGI